MRAIVVLTDLEVAFGINLPSRKLPIGFRFKSINVALDLRSIPEVVLMKPSAKCTLQKLVIRGIASFVPDKVSMESLPTPCVVRISFFRSEPSWSYYD